MCIVEVDGSGPTQERNSDEDFPTPAPAAFSLIVGQKAHRKVGQKKEQEDG